MNAASADDWEVVGAVIRDAMPVIRAGIQVLRPVGEPDLVIVADDLTAVISNLAGQA